MLGLLLSTASATVTIENVAQGKQVSIGPGAGATSASVNVRSAGQGQVNIIAGAAGTLTLLNTGGTGQVIVDGSCAVTTYNSANPNDTVTYSATAITTGQWGGSGTRKLQRTCTTATIDGGARVETNNSVAFTTATVSGGGTLAHDSDGTIATLNAKRGGTLQPVNTPFAVTTCNVWEGANIARNSDKITFTTVTPVGNAA